MSILAFFSVGESLGGGEGRFSGGGMANRAGAAGTVDDVGFFRPLRDGGGGASSVRPCDLNLDWYVFTVAVFSVSRRISIEIEAFLDMMGMDLGFCASLSLDAAVADGEVLAGATAGGGISLLSLSFSCFEDEDVDEVEDDDDDLSLRSLDELEPEVDDDDDEEDFEDLCLFEEEEDEPLLRSRSLLELEEPELERALSLSRYLSLELRWEEEEEEELLEELLFEEEEDDDEEDDLWLDEEDLWLEELSFFLSFSRSFSDRLLLSLLALLCFLLSTSSPDLTSAAELLSSKLDFFPRLTSANAWVAEASSCCCSSFLIFWAAAESVSSSSPSGLSTTGFHLMVMLLELLLLAAEVMVYVTGAPALSVLSEEEAESGTVAAAGPEAAGAAAWGAGVAAFCGAAGWTITLVFSVTIFSHCSTKRLARMRTPGKRGRKRQLVIPRQ